MFQIDTITKDQKVSDEFYASNVPTSPLPAINNHNNEEKV